MNEELLKLKAKLEKDAKQSEFRISEAQKEIQELVKERKELRATWEDKDAEFEGTILDLTNEVHGLLQRQLQAQEFAQQLELLTI